jgi:O-antigen/teichoic acid export membrane protein
MDKLMKYSACILLPLALGVGFFSRDILSIAFGPSFGAAALPLQIILIMKAIVGSLMVPIGGSFSGIGRPDMELKIGVVSSIVGVILSVVLISKFGITGAALSVCLSQLIRAGIYFGVLSYMVGIKIDSKWNISIFAMAGISIGVFWVETQSFNQYVVGASILFIFIFLLWTLFLTREDKTSLRRMAVSIFSKGSNKESTLRIR